MWPGNWMFYLRILQIESSKRDNILVQLRLINFYIRLLDEDGRTLNLNDGDITLSLEIEQLDAPYKNMVQ